VKDRVCPSHFADTQTQTPGPWLRPAKQYAVARNTSNLSKANVTHDSIGPAMWAINVRRVIKL